MTLKDVRYKLENGDIKGALSALDGYELRMHHARSKGGSVKSKAKSEAAKRRWEARIKSAAEEGDAYEVARLQALEALAAESQERGFEIVTDNLKAMAIERDFVPPTLASLRKGILPPGVMKGSDLEGRG